MTVAPDTAKALLPIKRQVSAHFGSSNWLELGTVTGALDVIQNHPRLLRALHFGDEDYEGCILDVLIKIVERDPQNITAIQEYLHDTFDDLAKNISSEVSEQRIVFSPSVFTIPDVEVDARLVSVMMPFSAAMGPVYDAIRKGASRQGLLTQRVDDLWEHSTVIQDIFSLVFRSSIVTCDFTGKNPNVFYECGIAHTLGKHVVPIAQHEGDVPFDLRHHRYLKYLPNEEGLEQLSERLSDRLATLSSPRT
ncbi:MAG: hypothetical protein AAF291_12125 [Pseudomonadota bacterium]